MWLFSKIKQLEQQAAYWETLYDEWHDIAQRLSQYAPAPTCQSCDGSELIEDPAGYYWHAERWDGAPLLCSKCADQEWERTKHIRRSD